ncbi:MAG TPA: hypothetical protein VLH08_08100 [Acidobacteriota bacterium]|nr:hypothetical protein [Acidobacteriota bacterium]
MSSPSINNSQFSKPVYSGPTEGAQPEKAAEQVSTTPTPTPTPTTQEPAKGKESSRQGATERAGDNSLTAALRSKDLNSHFEGVADVFNNSYVLQAQAKSATPAIKLPAYTTTLLDTVQNSRGLSSPLDTMVKGDDVKKWEASIKEVKDTYKQAGDLMKAGNYGQAKQVLSDMLTKKIPPVNNSGENILEGMKGVAQADSTKTLIKQLDYVDKMQKAGIKASLPPTMDELKQYFATFKSSPVDPKKVAAAKQSLQNYTEAFHVHPGEISGNQYDDVRYSPERSYSIDGKLFKTEAEAVKYQRDNNLSDKPITSVDTASPDSWDDVTSKRTTNKQGRFAGRVQNDCEGHAYLASVLLPEAGFKLDGFGTALNKQGLGHVMTILTDPEGNKVVTSNREIFDVHNVRLEGDDKEKLTQLLDQGWRAANIDPADKWPRFYLGNTAAESGANMALKHKHKSLP